MRLLVLLLFSACATDAPPAPSPPPAPLPRGISLLVDKSDRQLFVLGPDGAVLRSHAVGLGWDPVADKEQEGDGRTPHGRFRVAHRKPDSAYYKAFLIDYPRPEDARRGLAAGLIDEATAARIEAAHAAGRTPPQTTALGGYIELHGRGGQRDWTAGCVAVDDEVMDALWERVPVGSEIVIRP